VKPDKSSELLQEVRRQMGDGKFSRAFATLKDLLATNPSHHEGRRLLATLLLKFGNLATAKSAFETLVKEALQRLDYPEAESLLHEYLTAGPRYVPFVEMLGATYESKGDPLAAVFEYEKAIDILLEDPDPERPTYAQDLFQKIKELAPSSFVANRVAARLQPQNMTQTTVSALPEAPPEWGDPEEKTAVIASGPLELVELVKKDFVPGKINTRDGEVEEERTAVEPEESKWSSEVHEQPVIQSAVAQIMVPMDAASDERVPFPPVNRGSENQLAAKIDGEEHEGEPESDGFGDEPVCEPSRIRFYPEDSECVRSESDPMPVFPMEEGAVSEEENPTQPAKGDDRGSRQNTYWEQVMGGTNSMASPRQAPSASGFVATNVERASLGRHYGRDMARWLSFRLSILSRRLITTTNVFTKLILFVLLAIAAWGVLIIGGAASLWFGFEQKPSEVFQRLIGVSPPKTIEDWKNNGYILLIGFGASSSMDPMQAGYNRWLSANTESIQGCLDRIAKGQLVARVASPIQKPADWFKSPDPSAQFVAEGAQVKETIDPEGHLVSRYRRWLNLPFEDWGFNYLGSPDCGQILAVHRLYLAEGFTQSVSAGLDRLEIDLTAWRKVLAQARTLSTKAMAADGIGDDLAVMSGLLNHPTIENKVVQRMMRMARPLDPEERSLRWPMQNEFALAVKRMDSRVRPLANTDPSLAVAVAKMPLPKQRTLNTYAAYYDALIKASGSPHSSTPKLYDFANTPSRTWLDYGFNPIDNLIVADPTLDWDAITGTIMETDARLRLVGLQARLRTPSQDSSLVTRIAQAGPGFYDPFTELPMLVNATRGVLYSVGMDHKDDGGDPIFDVSVPFLQ
jgi:hypothetical protein